MSESRVTASHLSRKALLYIRQSSQQQVAQHVESRRLQYAMTERLKRLGWSAIEVIDSDLGRSAAGRVEREGFHRLVAEVSLGQVGIVAAREVSRLARNSKDWHQLIELCRFTKTLLADQEVIYEPRRANDRLLLGVKGSLSEYELDLIRLRAEEARRAKAARGELIVNVPAGFIKSGDRIEKDPDRRVQQAVQAVFEKFFELGSARQTLLWFLDHDLELPVGRVAGLASGQSRATWKRPSYRRVLNMLQNPAYGGAYAYGRTQVITEARDGTLRKRSVARAQEDWAVLIPDHHDGYVSWSDFQRIQTMLSNNRSTPRTQGAAKKGTALLSGLLRCHRCSRKLRVAYSGPKGVSPRYACERGHTDSGEPRCIAFGGNALDQRVSEEIMRVVEPLAIDAALLATHQSEDARHGVIEALELELEAARYTAGRAQRQFDAADPENRLVADELEKRWNDALMRVQELEQRIQRERDIGEAQITPTRQELMELASQFANVWNDEATDVKLKKRLARVLIHEIVVDVDETASDVVAWIHWAGGVHTEIRVRKRKPGESPAHTSQDVVGLVRSLARVCDDRTIAGLLNRNALRTGAGNRWTEQRVAGLRRRRGIRRFSAEDKHDEGWMTLSEAAAHAGVAAVSLRKAVERGEVAAEHPIPNGPWIFDCSILERPEAKSALARIASRRRRAASPAPEQLDLEISST